MLRQLSKCSDTNSKHHLAQLELREDSNLFVGCRFKGRERENNLRFSLQVKLELEVSEHFVDHRLNCAALGG
jgi:hypothetical protein